MSAHGSDAARPAVTRTDLTVATFAPTAALPTARRRRVHTTRSGRASGFTLIELLVVVAIVGFASGLVVLALRDPDASRLDQEGVRLVALLESARAESRTAGTVVAWIPVRGTEAIPGGGPADFRFVGLSPGISMPARWLEPKTSADLLGARALRLGPEPFIGPQRVVLRLGSRRLEVATDGLAPFAVVSTDTEVARP